MAWWEDLLNNVKGVYGAGDESFPTAAPMIKSAVLPGYIGSKIVPATIQSYKKGESLGDIASALSSKSQSPIDVSDLMGVNKQEALDKVNVEIPSPTDLGIPNPTEGLTELPKEEPKLDLSKFIQPRSTALPDVYGSELNDQALKEAQQSANLSRLMANLGAATSTIGAAFGRGNTPVDNTFYSNLAEKANAPVEALLTRRKAKESEIATQKAKMQAQQEADDANPLSRSSQVQREMFRAAFPRIAEQKGFEQLSANDLKDVRHVLETVSKTEAMKSEKEALREEKRAKEAKLSDKAVKDLQTFDDAITIAENIKAKKVDPSWVGPIDQYKPDWLVGPEAVRFKQDVMQQLNEYRHKITGAGAGLPEIKRLEKAMPNLSDDLPIFNAKLNEYISATKALKDSYLHNQEKHGKNITEFKSDMTQNQQPEVTQPRIDESSPLIESFMKKNPQVKSKKEAVQILNKEMEKRRG